MEKGSTQNGGNVVIYKAESKKSLFRQTAEKAGFGLHFGRVLGHFWSRLGSKWRPGVFFGRSKFCMKKGTCRKSQGVQGNRGPPGVDPPRFPECP